MFGSLLVQYLVGSFVDVAENRFDPFHGVVDAWWVVVKSGHPVACHLVDHGVKLPFGTFVDETDDAPRFFHVT